MKKTSGRTKKNVTSLAKGIFEVCGIFAFAMAFYFVGKLQGIREGQGMFLNILDNVGEALGAVEEQEEGEDDED